MISEDQMTQNMRIESSASYRLVYELVLPYLIPMFVLGKNSFYRNYISLELDLPTSRQTKDKLHKILTKLF